MIRALALLFLVAACGDDGGNPATLIDAPRILSVRATPPVLELGGVAQLDALVVSPGGTVFDTEVSWRACYPWVPLGSPVDNCTGESAIDLPGGVLSVDAVLEAFPPPAGNLEGLIAAGIGQACAVDFPAVEIPIVADAGFGPVVKGVLVSAISLEVPRTNPSIAGVLFDGVAVEPGATVAYDPASDVRVEPVISRDAVDPACDADTGEVELESFTVSLYATAGEFDQRRVSVELAEDGREAVGESLWTAPAEPGPVGLWLVATDPDGGAAWAEIALVPR